MIRIYKYTAHSINNALAVSPDLWENGENGSGGRKGTCPQTEPYGTPPFYNADA